MNLYLPDTDKIYFSQTKVYLEEIVRAYDVGNYRSAMVMLYSTIVCDLLMKLRELSDVYADKKAEKILKEIEASRSSHDMRSAWEWQLIDRLHKETQMIDDETYVMIQHMIIDRYSRSSSYVSGREWFDTFVESYLDRFSADQFVKLIEVINTNPQLYDYAGQFNRNTIIVNAAQRVLPEDFDYAKYEKFRFYQTSSDELDGEEVIDTDEEIPF